MINNKTHTLGKDGVGSSILLGSTTLSQRIRDLASAPFRGRTAMDRKRTRNTAHPLGKGVGIPFTRCSLDGLIFVDDCVTSTQFILQEDSMASGQLRAVNSGEGNSAPPIDRILKRLEIIENGLHEALNLLRPANDRLWGQVQQAAEPSAYVRSDSPAPTPRAPLLDEIDGQLSRIDSLVNRVSGEAGRVDNLSVR